MGLLALVYYAGQYYMVKRDREFWRRSAAHWRGEAQAKGMAVTVLRTDVKRLTPRRGRDGKFVGKGER